MPDTPVRPILEQTRALASSGRWALGVAWSTAPRPTSGLLATTLVTGVLPAGLALAARGIINATADGLRRADTDLSPVLPWLALGIALTLAGAVLRGLSSLLDRRLRDLLNLRISEWILAHASTLDLSFFEDPRHQDLLQRARQGTAENVHRFLTQSLRAVTSAVEVVTLFGILVVIDPLVVPALLVLTVPYFAYQWRLALRGYRLEYSRAAKRRWTQYFLSLITGRAAVGEVKLLGLAPLLRQRFRTLMEEFLEQDWKLQRRSFLGATGFGVVATLVLYAVFVRVVVRGLAGTVTLGDVAIFGGATTGLRNAMENLVLAARNTLQQTLFVSNLIEFLEVKPRIVSGPRRLEGTPRGELALEDVHFAYPGSTTPALRGLSLHVAPGETVALVGENGAGKTTLVKLVARLYDPDRGRILKDGIDLRELSLEQLHADVSFVFQSFVRYEATIGENIAYGNWQKLLNDRERVAEIARLTGVEELIRSMPKQYDTQLGRRFGEFDLSGGQWQRIAVARAFAREASLLILDEPTSNLDARAEYELFSKFRELARGRTTILVSHRFSTVAMADRIVVMEQGRVAESGSHAELLERDGVYASLYGLHRRWMDEA